ncbi:MAG: hypothetical protein JXB60_03305, partial [Candidatus Cloacimonetes bacterium]|nr:hypothetical protein [Candidatus Cloacimonadota bacterium]
MGIDPLLSDPDNGDFSLLPDSPAWGYGCQTFPDRIDKKYHLDRKHYIINNNRKLSRSIIEVGGLISENTVWDADTVLVTDNVTVDHGINLMIVPGAKIIFNGYFRIEVLGSLIAEGEPENKIVFDSSSPELYSPDSTQVGCWNGIRFNNTSSVNDSSRIVYCVIQHSKSVSLNEPGGALSFYNFSKVKLENCSIEKNYAAYGGAVACYYNANPLITGNLFTQNTALWSGSVLFSAYSYPQWRNNTIIDNNILIDDIFWSTGAMHNHLSKPLFQNNIIRGNSTPYFEQLQLWQNKNFYT